MRGELVGPALPRRPGPELGGVGWGVAGSGALDLLCDPASELSPLLRRGTRFGPCISSQTGYGVRMLSGQASSPGWGRTYEDEGTIEVVRNRPALLDLISSLIDDGECRFDHHGGCQEHGYLSLEPGEMCPQEEAKRLIEEASS